MIEDQVILVNEYDEQIGTMGKLDAHIKAKLHRAFSIFVFNSKNEWMIQQRALGKYHSGGLWTNTVCSHPRHGEPVAAAAHRRLREEMGFDCDLQQTFTFHYQAEVGNGLVEHEFDHVLFGHYEGEPDINQDEVISWKWISPDTIRKAIRTDPGNFSEWFKLVFGRVCAQIN